MSTTVMAACWPLQMPPTPKAVLISLADNANDQGVCWPSISTIGERTCFGRTAVIEAIRWLEQAGYLLADRSNGRHTTYQVLPNLGLFDGQKPVRVANRFVSRTGPADARHPSASRTGPVRQADTNRQEPSRTGCVGRAREIAVRASIDLRSKGVRCTPSNPNLLAAVSEGVTPQDLVDLAEGYPGKPVDYLISIARREHAEGAQPIPPGNPNAHRPSRRKLSAVEQVAQAIAERNQRRTDVVDVPAIRIAAG